MSKPMNITPGIASPRSVLAAFLLWLAKTALIWLTLLVGTTVAFRLFPVTLPPPPAHDGPFTAPQALLVVNGLFAVALSLLAARARVRGWRLALLLFVAQFAVGTLVLQLDTLYFNVYVTTPLTNAAIGLFALQAMITSALAAFVGAVLFRPADEAPLPLPANLTSRIAWTGLIYIVLYYTAGALIAWQSEAVRQHYGNGLAFHPLQMLAFEYFRGILWALTALFIATRLKGPLWSRALVMAVFYAVMTNAALFYPNASLTWDVRQMHLMEVGTSEFLYGIAATYALLLGAASRPIAGRLSPATPERHA